MRSYAIRIPLDPKAKASIRLSRSGHYNPSAKGMLQLRTFVKEQMQDNPLPKPLKGALFTIVHYKIPVPKSLSARKRQQQDTFPHCKKPDLDNLAKFLNDALNGLVWQDDSNICMTYQSKTYTKETKGETELIVVELGDGEINYSDVLMSLKQYLQPDVIR